MKIEFLEFFLYLFYMRSLNYFIFQRLIWKASTSYGFIIEFSNNEKLQKKRIILSQHTKYLHKWLVLFWHVWWCHVNFFFCEIRKYLQAKTRLAHLNWDFTTRFHPIRNFLANEIYYFSRLFHQTDCLFTGIALLIIRPLSSHFFLFQNATLHKILKLGF